MPPEPPARRGRPPSEDARRKILAAARALLDQHGLPGLTMEGIAARAGVGKPTVYRHWPNAHSVAMDAFLESEQAVTGTTEAGKALAALRGQLHGIAAAFASPAGRSTAAMVAAAQNDSELAKVFRNRFILRGREIGRALLLQAVREGAIRADAGIEVVLDLIYAPLYFRLLIGHGPLNRAFTDTLLDTVLEGVKLIDESPSPV